MHRRRMMIGGSASLIALANYGLTKPAGAAQPDCGRGGFEYWYKAIVADVYDGDSLTVDLDFGFEHWRKNMKLRLYGIDTPELRGDERAAGIAVRDYVRSLIPVGTPIVLNTFKDRTGKYGRYLARVWIDDLCLNDHLLETGRARAY